MLTNDYISENSLQEKHLQENNYSQEKWAITSGNGELFRKPTSREIDLQEPREAPPKCDLLLPVPDQEDIESFIALYQTQYGIELEPEQAHEILGGLMRFLFLTRRNRMEAPTQPQK